MRICYFCFTKRYIIVGFIYLGVCGVGLRVGLLASGDYCPLALVSVDYYYCSYML